MALGNDPLAEAKADRPFSGFDLIDYVISARADDRITEAEGEQILQLNTTRKPDFTVVYTVVPPAAD